MLSGRLPWSRNPAEKAAVFTDPAGVSPKTSAIWVAQLDRYLLATEHGRIASGEMGVFEAEEPWGPWRTVHYGDLDQGYRSLPDTTFLLHFVPNGFDDDGGFTLAFTGREQLDALNLVDGRFRLRP